MARRLEQLPKRYQKDQTGCVWGFSSILDFCHGRSTGRLLEDTSTGRQVIGAGYSRSKLQKLKTPNGDSRELDVGEGKDPLIADVTKTSVKELMEEEMFSEQKESEQNSADIKVREFDAESRGCVKKNPKRTRRTSKSSCDMHCELDAERNIGFQNNFCQDSEVETSLDVKHDRNNDFDIQLEQAYSAFDGKVIEALKVFVDQRLTVGKLITEYEKTECSNEFMNALQTLSSNKERILELLKDPNSLLAKHIEDLEDGQLHKDQKSSEPVAWKRHNFFRRKSKSQEEILLKGYENGQTSNRIVILKPGPASFQISQPEAKLLPLRSSHHKVHTKRIASQFSLHKIKRKLKYAMGKERHGVPLDDITLRVFPKHQNSGSSGKGFGGEKVGCNSPNRNNFCNERFARLAIGNNNKEKSCNPNDTETSMENGDMEHSKLRVYYNDLYTEAKKHLSEMLSDGDEIEDFSSTQLPKILGRILSLPDFNLSPNFVMGQKRFLCGNSFHKDSEQIRQDEDVCHLGPSRENFISRSCTAENTLQSSNFKSDILDEHSHANAVEATLCSMRPVKSIEADVEIVEITDASVREESRVLDISVEQCSSLVIRDEQDGDLSEFCDEDDYAQCLKSDSFEEGRLNSSPERPSPVFVLDPSFTDDDMSHSILKSQPVELPVLPREIIFEVSPATNQEIFVRSCMEDEESSFDYVEAVLLASDLNWQEFLSRWLSSDRILDESLFDEVELFSNRSHHDQKLLFDCTNEILEEVCGRYFGSSPWVSFVEHNIRPIPRGKSLIHEVWHGVEWYILSQPYSSTLDQMVGKDMSKTGTWMNLRFDVENTAIELGEAILEELVDEIIWTSLNEGLENCSPVRLETCSSVHPEELIKNRIIRVAPKNGR